jgi:hypothetical protein
MFKELHPSRGYRPVDNDSVTSGRNAETPEFPESGFIKCNKCGYTMNKHRHPKGWGDGVRLQAETANWDEVYWDEFFWDGASQTQPLVVGGCPQCGTYNYDGSFDDRRNK